MKRYIIGILLISLIACNDSKQNRQINTQVPEVEFDFSDMPENKETKPDIYVNDLENIFTKGQNTELENYLARINKESGKKILILTIPSKEKSNEDWRIENGFTNNGIIITISESSKNVGIGIAKDTEDILSEKIRKMIIENTIIPEFEKENYYSGIKKGIEQILNYWK